MPRTARVAPGGWVFHVLNRGNARARIFKRGGDYHSFERVMTETVDRVPMRILAYCIMPNHWHMVLWPHEDGDLGTFMQRLTVTHVRRWHLHRQSVGTGHLYQGTYKSFPVQSDEHFLTVCRYVERNPLRADLVERAEHWRWSSLGLRLASTPQPDRPPLSRWPVGQPRNWLQAVNRPHTEAEVEAVRPAPKAWQKRAARTLGLESTFRSRGRPRKEN